MDSRYDLVEQDSDFELSKEIVKNLMKEVYQQACELD